MRSRRNLIKAIGGTVALTTLPSTGIATTITETELRKQLDRLTHRGDVKKAKGLLDKNNLSYKSRTNRISKPNSTNPNKVSTQDFYASEKARIDYILTKLPSSGHYYANINWELKQDDEVLRGTEFPAPKDGVAIGWEDSQWGFVKDSVNTANTLRWISEATGDVSNKMETSPELESGPFMDPADTVGYKTKDGEKGDEYFYADEIGGFLSLKLRKQDHRVGSVGMNYSHNWTNKVKSVGNIIGNVALEGEGTNVAFDIPGGADKWPKDTGREVLESDT